MLDRKYSREQRRALNIIWNAAGRYGWDPYFMAFQQDGKPDFYFNTLLGLSDKYLGAERVQTFFSRYESAGRRDEFDDLLWLALESWLYARELPVRPALTGLRREHAERFFRELQLLSRQEMMIHSALTYTQQEIRWAAATGRREPPLTPREKRLRDALMLDPSLDADGVFRALDSILSEFFRFDASAQRKKAPSRGGLLGPLLRREHRNADRLVVRAGALRDPDWRMQHLSHRAVSRRGSDDLAADRAYIRALFGPGILPDQEVERLENRLCTGPDEGCSLHLTDARLPVPGEGSSLRPAEREALREAAAQEERNRAYRQEHITAVTGAVRTLTGQFERIFAAFAQPLPEASRAGELRSELAWRLPVLGDPSVFLRPGEEREMGVAVTILLDASSSRMNTQEIISAQSEILAEALEKCSIPVEVAAFRSLRGFTVLQRLKTFSQRCPGRISAYYTGGWNRDSLALRAAGELAGREDLSAVTGGSVRRVMLVLTDAAPNDSAPLPPEKGKMLPREYEGEPAVAATAAAVKELRDEGWFVGAVYYGSTANLENLHRIYGKESVRIRSLEQIASAGGDLLQLMLRELESRG